MILSDNIVVFSKQALSILKSKHSCKKIHTLPLMPYSDVKTENFNADKYYDLAFIGRIHPAKNFDFFLELVRLLAVEGNTNTVLVSNSTEIVESLDTEIYDNLNIISHATIEDAEIEDVMRRTKIIYKLDKNMMQSGIVAQCKYFGCDVLVNNIDGFSQEDFKSSLLFATINDGCERVISKLNERFQSIENRDMKCLEVRVREKHNSDIQKWACFFNELLA